jgi:hypothetical protein
VKRRIGIGTLVGLLGGAGTLAAQRLRRRTRPWYERLGHIHRPTTKDLRRLVRR